jgi:two-component system sensor histidine kinase RegB
MNWTILWRMTSRPSKPGFDKPPPASPQEPDHQTPRGPWAVFTGGPGGMGLPRRSRLRMRTLVTQRWIAIAGQSAAVLVCGLLFKFELPWIGCFALIGLAAWLNLILTFTSPGQRLALDWETALQLTFDTLQLSGLLYLTGGIANPFSLLLIAPAVLAATTLPSRYALFIGVLAMCASVLLAVISLPMPPPLNDFAAPHAINQLGWLVANLLGIAATAGYAWAAATEAARMELALDVTQTVLAREQKLSALGGLAAAAAHELGTPLATIAIVAREMARAATTDDAREDAELMIAQAARCREILARLTATPEAADDPVHERLSLEQLLHEVIEPHEGGRVRVEAVVTGGPGAAPAVRRLPEIIHAMTSFVENGTDFAAREVLVTARFDARHVSVEVRDDGPGFAPEILAKLGEPYVTTRPGAENSRSGHIGMGLGFFIAKTLLERTGATVDFRNEKRGGAVVLARWPRPALEAAEDGALGLDELEGRATT